MSNAPRLATSHDDTDVDTDDHPPIEEMNPASKLVYVVLEREGPLSTSDLAEKTRLKVDTVRRRTARLNEAGHIRSRPKLPNPNENVHELRASDSNADTGGDRRD